MTPNPGSIPAHFAIIMDGNGRWAKRRGEPRTSGHLAGARVIRDVVTHSATCGVQHLTLYAFSSDNWKRPRTEVVALLSLFTSHLQDHARELAQQGIRLSIIGRRDRIPASLRRAIMKAESITAGGSVMHLRIAIDYSSRDMIQRAHASINENFEPASSLLPPVDLLLRTGGERRLSDFLLWECAYAELLFVDVLWPDVSVAVLDDAFRDYAQRERRFGCTEDTRVFCAP